MTSVVKIPIPSSVSSAGTLPTVFTTDYADSADISVIPNHPYSSVTSVVKNSDSVFRVFRGRSSDRFHHRSRGYFPDPQSSVLIRDIRAIRAIRAIRGQKFRVRLPYLPWTLFRSSKRASIIPMRVQDESNTGFL